MKSCYNVISEWIEQDGAKAAESCPAAEKRQSYDLDEFERFAYNFSLSDYMGEESEGKAADYGGKE